MNATRYFHKALVLSLHPDEAARLILVSAISSGIRVFTLHVRHLQYFNVYHYYVSKRVFHIYTQY